MIASRVGVADAVRVLLERGAVVDTRDKTYQQTALMVAVRENHPAIVQMLIERGADVNAKTRTGQTPQYVLPNSVPGFGHGIGIVRGVECRVAGRKRTARLRDRCCRQRAVANSGGLELAIDPGSRPRSPRPQQRQGRGIRRHGSTVAGRRRVGTRAGCPSGY